MPTSVAPSRTGRKPTLRGPSSISCSTYVGSHGAGPQQPHSGSAPQVASLEKSSSSVLRRKTIKNQHPSFKTRALSISQMHETDTSAAFRLPEFSGRHAQACKNCRNASRLEKRPAQRLARQLIHTHSSLEASCNSTTGCFTQSRLQNQIWTMATQEKGGNGGTHMQGVHSFHISCTGPRVGMHTLLHLHVTTTSVKFI